MGGRSGQSIARGSLYFRPGSGSGGNEIEKQTESFINLLRKIGVSSDFSWDSGVVWYNIHRSVTDFGKSNYITLRTIYNGSPIEIAKVRISDHSVGHRRLLNEIHYVSLAINKDVRDRFIKGVKSWIK